MAATITPYPIRLWSRRIKIRLVEVACDASYQAGGYAISAASVDLPVGSTFFVFPMTSTGGFVWAWDQTNLKIMGFKGTATAVALTQVSTTDVQNETVLCLVVGI